MSEKKMSFGEFENKVKQELAYYLSADVNSEIVRERMSEQDSIDIIENEYGNYTIRLGDKSRAGKAHRHEWSCAASCIFML